jgi:hypothetical protein
MNIHALHNAHLLHQALPCELTQPTPIYDDKTQIQAHNDWAAKLWVSGLAKRQARKEKAATTPAKNKQ